MSTKQIYLLETEEYCPDAEMFRPIRQVIRAACETCARSVAAGEAKAEGPAVWRDPNRSTCKRVNEDGKSGVVLRSEG